LEKDSMKDIKEFYKNYLHPIILSLDHGKHSRTCAKHTKKIGRIIHRVIR
jgi:fructose/tagatose bisphosphate aldolase